MPTRAAVVIGVNYTEAPAGPPAVTPLRFAEADAQAMRVLLEQDGYTVVTLLGAAATRRAIIGALEQQSREAGPTGLLLTYFAGHGDVDSYNPDIAYLLPADADPDALGATAIPLDDIARRHLGLAGTALTLLDCCHSGYAAGVRGHAEPAEMGREFGQSAQNTFARVRNRIVLAACAGDQLARELAALGHGAFTYYVLDHWRSTPGADDLSLSRAVAAALEQARLPRPVRGGVQEGLVVLRAASPAPSPASGATPAQAGPPASATEQRKQVTVLCVDLAGSPGLDGTLDPEDRQEALAALGNRVNSVISGHGGTPLPPRGETLLAVFGAERAREDDAEQAIGAALALQAAGDSELRRIVINTGLALISTSGPTGAVEVTGEPVTLARRLAETPGEAGVLITYDTYRLVRGLFGVASLPPLSVPGQRDPVPIYQVTGAKPRSFHIDRHSVEGIETPLVGRAVELARLTEALEMVLDEGGAQVVTVLGEAGLGKSRLLYEFTAALELHPETVWLFKARARPESRQLPYSLLRDLLAFRFAVAADEPAAAARRKLVAGVTAFMGPGHEEAAQFLGQLIGLDFSTSPALAGIAQDARQIRERAFHAATQFFQAVTHRQPAVILLEDLHWADDGSLDLIDHLARTCGDRPLLVVGLARPELLERRRAWGEDATIHTRLTLAPLNKRDTRRLATALLQKLPVIPPALLDLVTGQAEGNPFYVEELIKMLIDDGVIRVGTAGWGIRPEGLATVRVPPTLTGVLQARLDSLPPTARETLQRAAVVGRIFWDGAVERLQQAEGRPGESAADAATQAGLSAARGKELVFRRETSTVAEAQEYVFKHALLRDVTYESVLKRRRRVYHAAVAAWLTERSGERADEIAGLIGEHYEQAEAGEQAGEWYARAGRQAQATDAPALAIDYYRKALALTPAAPAYQGARLEIYEGLGEVLGRQARYTEAGEAYQTLATGAAAAGDAAAQARAWNGLAWIQERQGDYQAVLASAEQAAALARTAGVATEGARALHWKIWVLSRLGQLAEAQALGEQALAQARLAEPDSYALARNLNVLGTILDDLGNYAQAAEYKEQALALFRARGDRRWVGNMLNNLGVTAWGQGDYVTTAARYAEALAVAREIGNRDSEPLYLSNLGNARVELGAYHEAEADQRAAIQAAEVQGARGILASAYYGLANALLGQGQVAAALGAAQEALAHAQAVGYLKDVAVAWRTLGQVRARMASPLVLDGRAYDAPACFAESLQISTERGMDGERARTLRAWAEYAWAQGDHERGRAMWQEARDIFARVGATFEVARMGPAPGAPAAAPE